MGREHPKMRNKKTFTLAIVGLPFSGSVRPTMASVFCKWKRTPMSNENNNVAKSNNAADRLKYFNGCAIYSFADDGGINIKLSGEIVKNLSRIAAVMNRSKWMADDNSPLTILGEFVCFYSFQHLFETNGSLICSPKDETDMICDSLDYETNDEKIEDERKEKLRADFAEEFGWCK